MTLRTSIRCGLPIAVLGFGIGVLGTSPALAKVTRSAAFISANSRAYKLVIRRLRVRQHGYSAGRSIRSALGQPIKHPGGYMVKLKRPLKLEAVTDHAEYAGTVRLANDPNSPISKLPIADKLKVRSKDDIQKVYLFLGNSMLKNQPIKELLRAASGRQRLETDGRYCRQVLPAGQVHDLCGLRMEFDAEQQ